MESYWKKDLVPTRLLDPVMQGVIWTGPSRTQDPATASCNLETFGTTEPYFAFKPGLKVRLFHKLKDWSTSTSEVYCRSHKSLAYTQTHFSIKTCTFQCNEVCWIKKYKDQISLNNTLFNDSNLWCESLKKFLRAFWLCGLIWSLQYTDPDRHCCCSAASQTHILTSFHFDFVLLF